MSIYTCIYIYILYLNIYIYEYILYTYINVNLFEEECVYILLYLNNMILVKKLHYDTAY